MAVGESGENRQIVTIPLECNLNLDCKGNPVIHFHNYLKIDRSMNEKTIKQRLINRIMKVKDVATLKRIEHLTIQAEMEATAEKSLQAIGKGQVITLKEFSDENRKWLKKND